MSGAGSDLTDVGASDGEPDGEPGRGPVDGRSADGDGGGQDRRRSLLELVMDNLPAWAVIATAIALLYLVWASVEVFNHYVGPIPKVIP